ncbi:MAG: hypothetical protein ACM3N4_00435 [Nitrososphaerota archaeon]
MRTTRRTVILLGCTGFVVLYVLQYRAALAATPAILVVGGLTGLVTAKWLPWAWYGRQFSAGVRAGALTCGLSALGLLVSLVSSGSRQVAEIAARSHLPGLDLAQVVTTLGSAGWFSAYVLLTLFFGVGGVLLSGAVTRVAGWNKSMRTVRVIREAHDSAALLHRIQTWGPASNSIPSVAGYWNSVLPSAGPASNPGAVAVASMSSTVHPLTSHAPISATQVPRAGFAQDGLIEQQPPYFKSLPPLGFDDAASLVPMPSAPEPSAPEPSAPEPIPPRRTSSGAQPVQFALTDDLRSALDHWQHEDESAGQKDMEPVAEADAGASDEPDTPQKSAAKKASVSKAKTPAKHRPKASAYLNSEPPVTPRRNRKKQNTRDWLC